MGSMDLGGLLQRVGSVHLWSSFVIVFLVSNGLGLGRAGNEFRFHSHFQKIFFNKEN